MDTLPPVSFYFRLSLKSDSANVLDAASFKEVSGLSASNTPETTEGGENEFSYRLPNAAKHQNLTLRNGLITQSSPLYAWIDKTLKSDFSTPIKPQTMRVDLVDAGGNVTMAWAFHQAFPVRLSLAGLSSEENTLSVETLELAYSYFEINT